MKPRDPFEKSLASYSGPSWMKRKDLSRSEETEWQSEFSRAKRSYNAAGDALREKLPDIITAGAIVVPEYRGYCPVVPYALYGSAEHPQDIHYQRLQNPKDKDDRKSADDIDTSRSFHFLVTASHRDEYLWDQKDDAVLWRNIRANGNQADLQKNVFNALNRIKGQSILLNCALKLRPEIPQTVYVERYNIHPDLRQAGMDSEFITNLMQIYHDQLGYKVISVPKEDLPPLDELQKQLSSHGIRCMNLVDLHLDNDDDWETIDAFDPSRQVLFYNADESLFEFNGPELS